MTVDTIHPRNSGCIVYIGSCRFYIINNASFSPLSTSWLWPEIFGELWTQLSWALPGWEAKRKATVKNLSSRGIVRVDIGFYIWIIVRAL